MGNLFKWALKFYKYGALLFIIIYCIYLVVDDYVLFKYINGVSGLFTFLSFQIVYLVFCFIGFSFFYWVIALLVIFITRVFVKIK